MNIPNEIKDKLIVELEQSNIQRKQAENKYRHLFNSLGDAIFVHDMNGQILDVNDYACQRYGYSYEKFKTMQVKDIDTPEESELIEKRFEKLFKNGQITFETIHLDSHQRQIPVEATAKLGEYEGQQVVLVIGHDITKRKAMAEDLLKAKKLESMGILAGGIAHDFNNILAGILGNVELAGIYLDPTHKAHPLLENAKKASIRAKDLTQQLLTFASGGDPVKQTLSIGKIITDSADFVLHGSSVICNYNIPQDLWKGNIDGGQISRVIQNIIINARHAMPDGGIVEVCCENIIDINKEVTSLDGGKYIKITITDSGLGIPTRCIDRVFDPFFSTKHTGSGLGLAICHSIVSKHSGKISVQSEVNKGTVFTIYLPAIMETDYQETAPTKQGIVKSENKVTVLVMDDESLVRETLRQMLKHLGHGVILAKNGHEAIKLYSEYYKSGQSIDVIILDLSIPGGMGGKDTIQEILKVNSDAKVVVASGYSNDPVMAHYSEYGFKASIAKPFQLEELNKVINTVLL